MRQHPVGILVGLAALVLAAPVHADRGALSLDLGTGFTSLALPPPYAQRGSPAWTMALSVTAGVRFAVTHDLELSLTGFDELPAGLQHSDVVVATVDSGSFSGTLRGNVSRFGLVAGLRFVTGLTVRWFAGLEVGWSRRSYESLQLLDTARPGSPDYGLGLQDFATDSLVLQPVAGLEWAFADHWSTSLGLCLTALLGPEAAVGVSLSVSISYVWFP